MINPVITKKMGEYSVSESCLSLTGSRECSRYRYIEVRYQDENFKEKTGRYEGLIAEIIQHEMDHFDGILI